VTTHFPSIQKSAAAAKRAVDDYHRTLVRAQKRCRHRHLVECDYESHTFLASLPPQRACTLCGLSEEGWGCGYQVLKGNTSGVTRSALYRIRLGLLIGDKEKTHLIRKEKTVADLLDEWLAEVTK